MKKVKPIKIVTLDTETYNGLIGGLKRIAIYDGCKVVYGFTFEDVEKKLVRYYDSGYEVICYIHNLEFDARKIPVIFDDSRINWKKCFSINGKLGRISCKKYTFIDSMKILPMSLSKASRDFNVEHGKLDLWEEVKKRYGKKYRDIVDFLDRCDVDDSLFLEYLGYDVMSLYEVIFKLIEVSGLSEREFTKCNTVASLSRYIFKHGYKGKPFKDPNCYRTDYEMLTCYDYTTHMDMENFARAGYYGGRTEVFVPVLDHGGFHYDINSQYGFVCETELPIGKPKYINNPIECENYFKTWQKNKKSMGFLSCEIYIPMQNIPPLPCKMGKLTFPCGTVYGTWTFEELDYAITECGCIVKKYYEVMYFWSKFPVFRRFIQTFAELKISADAEGNTALRTFSKFMINVAYGYTGMRRDDKTKLDSISNYSNYDSEEVVSVNSELGYIEIRQEVKSKYIQVPVAAYITSRARLLILKALKDADSKGTVYYCDTDSMVTDIELDTSLVDARKLGYFKLESRPVKAIFLQPKVYSEIFETEKEKAEKILYDGNENNRIWQDADGKYYEVEKKFKGVSKDTQNSFTYFDYQCFLKEFTEQSKKQLTVERNKVVLRSIMYMQKKGLSYDTYEIREKNVNLMAGQKRLMDYKHNKTYPHFFRTVEEYENFNYRLASDVEFDFTKRS